VWAKIGWLSFGGPAGQIALMRAVETYAWLSPGEMLDGLALAETTPGPLIMVVQYVAFIGAFRHPGTLSPYAAAVLGSLLTTWVTFIPCFLWIFLGAPYIESLRSNRTLERQSVSGPLAGAARFSWRGRVHVSPVK
jgi:chromate transporter